MAWISKEQVSEIRKELKKAFPEYKFSVTGSNSSQISVSVMSGPVPFEQIYDLLFQGDRLHYSFDKEYHEKQRKHAIQDGYAQFLIINKDAKCFRKLDQIVNQFNYDNSNAQVDYFDVGYYTSFSIGKYNMPYKQK